MFISRIKTINFGAARDNEVRLADGLVVVRAPNGAGKSSLFYQAPMYAFFGTSTLDGTFDDTVTEGEKPSTLLVEVDYGPYTWKRSKSSASVVGNGLQISGQAEVTSFSEQLFGVGKESAEMVLVSKQGETSGLVKKKSAAINQFIEEAANFRQLEDIVERAKILYPSGNVELFEQGIEKSKQGIVDISTNLDLLKDEETELSFKTHGYEQEILLRTESKSRVAAEFGQLDEMLKRAESANSRILRVKESISKEDENNLNIASKLGELASKVYRTFTDEELANARAYVEAYHQLREEWLEYQSFLGMKLEDPYWEGEEASFLAELNNKITLERELVGEINELKSDIKVQKSKISDTSVCPTCGTDISHKVDEVNAKAETEIVRISATLEEKTKLLSVVSAEVKALKNIKSRHTVRDTKYITWDTNTVPFTAKWERGEPATPNLSELHSCNELLQNHRDTFKDMELDSTRKRELEEMLQQSLARLVEYQSDIGGLGGVIDVGELKSSKDAAWNMLVAVSKDLSTLEEAKKEVDSRLIKLAAEIGAGKSRVVELEADINNTERRIKQDKENSLFVKVLRETRPKVLQKVWANILTLIETPFQEMTEKDMKIDRNSKGFTAGGRSTSRLSGSEASVLGLCFRSALRDLFAPGAGFTIYDEPFADCSVERTAVGIAALMQIRGQRILITHDEQTELSADQVVEL
jgi:hypothetical protein